MIEVETIPFSSVEIEVYNDTAISFFKLQGGLKLWFESEKMSLKIKLDCLRTNNSFFFLLGDKQNFKVGGI